MYSMRGSFAAEVAITFESSGAKSALVPLKLK